MSSPASDYSAEVRFGVVMYGGVSLAIYINGVANELFEMACATPLSGAALDGGKASGTREVYRRLSLLAANAPLLADYAARLAQPSRAQQDAWQAEFDLRPPKRTRFLVDVIAGTSAGGINGVFLAKALVNAQRFDSLRHLWVREGDIGRLLNDERSWEGLPHGIEGRTRPPASLLNSDRMYLKLLEALEQMDSIPVERQPADPGRSPLVEELDLYLTTTDIRGTPVPLRLSDKVIYERRHKQSFHFSYPQLSVEAGGDRRFDFNRDQHCFLAFAARCTSSFPFAFEPMTLARIADLVPKETVDRLRRFDRHFSNFPAVKVQVGGHVRLPFGDGGYLDNKPLSYVADTLSQRFGDAPAQRKLIYVDPDPERLDPQLDSRGRLDPDAVGHALDALTTIPLYETIRQDLETVLARNRRIERVEGLVHATEASIESDAGLSDNPFAAVRLDAKGNPPDWRTLSLNTMVSYWGRAVLPYRKLRVYALTDRLTTQLAAAWDVDPASAPYQALRALVRDWREARFGEEPVSGTSRLPFNEFLYCFDFDYRVRRTAFLMRRIDRIRRVLELPALQSGQGRLDELDLTLQTAWRRHWTRASTSRPFDDQARDRALEAMRTLKRRLRATYQSMLEWREEPRRLWRAKRKARRKLPSVLDMLVGDGKLSSAAGVDDMTHSTEPPTVLDRAVARLNALQRSGDADLMLVLEDVRVALETLQIEEAVQAGSKNTAPVPEPDDPHALTLEVWNLLGMPHLGTRPGKAAEGSPKDVQACLEVAAASSMTPGDDLKALNGSEGQVLLHMLGESFLMFDQFDQTRFTMYYETDTGEPARVDVIRVSPLDATHLVDENAANNDRRKLAGTALAHFGAFLDERWRRNDIMWGRLDGAERLITTLLPGDGPVAAVRDDLIRQAHASILQETLIPNGQTELAAMLCRALEEIPGKGVEQRLRDLVTSLKLGSGPQQVRLVDMLTSLLNDEGLARHVRAEHLVDRQLDPAAALDNAARAVTITGKVLQGISTGPASVPGLARWVARAGLVMQGAVALSIPGTWLQGWWRRAVFVLYGLEAVLLAATTLSGPDEVRTAVIHLALATVAVHVVTLVLGDYARRRRRWQVALSVLVVVPILALGFLGVRGLQTVGLDKLLFSPSNAASGAAGKSKASLSGILHGQTARSAVRWAAEMRAVSTR